MWRTHNKEKYTEYNRIRLANAQYRIEQRAREKAYKQTPEGKSIRKAQDHRRRAAKLNLPRVKYDPSQIIVRDNATCNLCGFRVDPDNYHIEHIIPLQVDPQILSSYGLEHPGDVPWNVSVAHPSCNSSKGNRMSQEDYGFYLLSQYLYKE